MDHLAAALHTLGIRLSSRASAGRERGSVTIEQVLWAVAVIVGAPAQNERKDSINEAR